MKKRLLLLLLLSILVFPIYSSITFTDSLNRVREFDNIDKVAAAGRPAELMISALSPELLVGKTFNPSEEVLEYFPYLRELPLYGKFYGSKSNLNREELILSGADVIIDVGELKKGIEEDLNQLEKETGIPVVYIESYLENTPEAFLKIAELIGKTDKSEKLADFARATLENGKRVNELIDEKKTVYYSTSEDGLFTFPRGSFHTEAIELSGGTNVVPESFQAGGGKISLEELFILDPDVIVLSNERGYENVTRDPRWENLTAVKNDEVYLIPTLPYSFIDAPPAHNRIIGIDWLTKLLYPELNKDMNIRERIKTFYSFFYDKDLSDSELADILHLSGV